MKLLQLVVIIGAALSMSACSGLTQLQDTVAKFDQGAHLASAAQMSYFKQVQASECDRDFYNEAYAFATARKDPLTNKYPVVSCNLTPVCTPHELTNDQLKIRQNLMDTITLYADAIQTLANGTDNTDLNTNSKSLASNIQALAKQEGITAVTTTNTAAVNAAVVAITSMILDHTKYKDIKNAAASVQSELATVVDELKDENLADAKLQAARASVLSNQYKASLFAARDQKGSASFFDIVEAHNILQSISAPPNVAKLNGTLDALVAANQAIARTTNGGAIPEISDLISRAQQAVTLFNSTK